MTDYGVAFAMSACISCGRIFCYDPVKVPSILIDPTTRLPPAPTLTAEARSAREPVCPDCCKAANPERRRLGYEPFPEHDTAETIEPGNWLDLE